MSEATPSSANFSNNAYDLKIAGGEYNSFHKHEPLSVKQYKSLNETLPSNNTYLHILPDHNPEVSRAEITQEMSALEEQGENAYDYINPLSVTSDYLQPVQNVNKENVNKQQENNDATQQPENNNATQQSENNDATQQSENNDATQQPKNNDATQQPENNDATQQPKTMMPRANNDQPNTTSYSENCHVPSFLY